MDETVREKQADYNRICTCSLHQALDLIRRKWAIHIVMTLYNYQAPIRFTQIERELSPISQKELTKRLRELEQAGIISRTVYPVVPPHVEYTLTASGAALKTVLDGLASWIDQYQLLTPTPTIE